MNDPSIPGGSVRRRRLLRSAHRWLGLLIAVQLVCWVAGGVIMSALRLDEVRGRDRAADHPPAVLAPSDAWRSPAEVLGATTLDGVSRVTLTTLMGRPVYRLQNGRDNELVDAVTGSRLSPLPEETAVALARADYDGPVAVAGVDWLETPAVEYRGAPLPLWRVRMADDRNTALYISPATGEIVARRNDLWRVFDFVWMLHIMDYEEREDFNHPLLLATASTALLFVVTGLAMLFVSFRRRRAGPA